MKINLDIIGHDEITGTFALRPPRYQDPVGAAVIRIEDISDNAISVRGLDCLN